MTSVTRAFAAPPARVFSTIVDPETYPSWLVGCKEIRAVDDDWPAVGSEFHHRVGIAGPLTIADSTAVAAIDAPRELTLEVRARPLGRAEAEFRLEPTPTGGTIVTLREVPIGAMRPAGPLLSPFTVLRNRTSLRQLDEYLVGRH